MKHKSHHKHKPPPSSSSMNNTASDVDYDYHFAKRRRHEPEESNRPTKRPCLDPSLSAIYAGEEGIVVPCSFPPVCTVTLDDIDIKYFMNNVQLRHNHLFDPNFQMHKDTTLLRQARANLYWRALQHEVNTGCACAVYEAFTGQFLTQCCARGVSVEKGLPCGGFPSRLGTMLQQLPSALIHVLAPLLVTRLPSRPTSSSETTLKPDKPRQVDPTYYEPGSVRSLIPAETRHELRSIIEHMDVPLMEREIRMGLYEPEGLMLLIGSTLKRHCAPMRDGMVDHFLARVVKPREVGGMSDARRERKTRTIKSFKLAFNILEVMKLDVTNHELQRFRLYLQDSTVSAERRYFALEYKKYKYTKAFLRRGLDEVVGSPSYTTSTSHRTIIHKTILSSFTHLIFCPPSNKGSLPETLSLDLERVNILIRDAADLAGVYMVLLLWRQLIFADLDLVQSLESQGTKNANPLKLEDWEVERVKREIWDLPPKDGIGKCFWFDEGAGEEVEAARREWEEGMEGIVVQVVLRAEEAREDLRKRLAAAGKLKSNYTVEPHVKQEESEHDPHVAHSTEPDTTLLSPAPTLTLPPFSPLPPSSSFAASFTRTSPIPSPGTLSPGPASASTSLSFNTPSSSHSASSRQPLTPKLPSATSLAIMRSWIKTQMQRSSPLAIKLREAVRKEVMSVTGKLLMDMSDSTSTGPIVPIVGDGQEPKVPRQGMAEPASGPQGQAFVFFNPYQQAHQAHIPGQAKDRGAGQVHRHIVPHSSIVASTTSSNTPASFSTLPANDASSSSPTAKYQFTFTFPSSSSSESTSAITTLGSPVPAPSALRLGLEPLQPEIQHLSARLAKLISIHETVHWEKYELGDLVDWPWTAEEDKDKSVKLEP